MENKKNISAYKPNEEGMSKNKILLAAIGGAAAGIAIAGILSSKKGKVWLGKVSETATQFANEHKDQFNFDNISNLIVSKLKNKVS